MIRKGEGGRRWEYPPKALPFFQDWVHNEFWREALDGNASLLGAENVGNVRALESKEAGLVVSGCNTHM